MLRTALRPRWLALLAIVLLAASGMSLLGRWQLDRAKDHGAQESRQNAAPAPLEELLKPRDTFPRTAQGAHVTLTGQWDDARRVLLAGRELNGRQGFWVMVPVRLGDGSGVGVVRGWVPSASDPLATAPSGEVTVTGLLHPTEVPVDRAPGEASGLPAGQLERLAITDLLDIWPYPLITGYVAAETETTADGAALQPAPLRLPRPSAEDGGGLDWRNVGYAVQWWLFAGFGLFMWWRLVRDDHRGPAAGSGPPVGKDEEPAEPAEPQGVAP